MALPLVPVVVSSSESKRKVHTYALLDSGSNVSLCDEKLLKDLGVTGKKEALKLTTLEKEDSAFLTTVASLNVRGKSGSTTVRLSRVFSRKGLNLKRDSLVTREEVKRWPHLEGLPLPGAKTGEIRLLIGQDCPQALAPLSTILGAEGEPFAVKTCLGWTVNGPITKGEQVQRPTSCGAQAEALNRLNDQVCKFWKLESGGVFDQRRAMSASDEAVVQRWSEMAEYKDNRYSLPIPFKKKNPRFPNNKVLAERRLASLGNRLCNNAALRIAYEEGMKDLISKGHAIAVTKEEMIRADGKVWYLPHHPVVNPNKEKPRIVFDCAAEYRGFSLNNQVFPGPDLTNKLIGVLLKFRLRPVAVMADIEAMFHQVKVEQSDQDVLRFLWWKNGDMDQQPDVFRMTSHLFGGAWSPSCCAYALRRTVEDHGKGYDEATCTTALNNFYVDDCLKSVATVEEAIELVQQLTSLLQKGGFRLTKWTANKQVVLDTIPSGERSKKLIEREFDAPLEDRALGVYWNVDKDSLGYRVTRTHRPATKRGILSVLSSVYDPLGLAGPFILRARMIVQDLCRKKTEWDEPVERKYQDRWERWIRELSDVTTLEVPRCIQPAEVVRRQLHHFSDASADAYGVASYIRSETSAGEVTVRIVMAKSRLAPIKPITIPRLELQAAVLATRQDVLLKQEMTETYSPSVFWTDSTIVLRYIRNLDARYHVFTANRIGEIREKTEVGNWRYVPTALNPADDASRGVSVAVLTGDRWQEGPAFLKLPSEEWPADKGTGPIEPEDPEVRRETKAAMAVPSVRTDNPLEKLMEHYSNWQRLLRAVACFLLIPEVKIRRSPKVDCLDADHLKRAEAALVTYLQTIYYEREMSALKQGRPVPADSTLRRLQLTIKGGLLTLNGRLANALVPTETKHPAILPASHPIMEAMVRDIHERSAHSGREYVLAELKRKYWVVGAANLVRKTLAKCVFCKK